MSGPITKMKVPVAFPTAEVSDALRNELLGSVRSIADTRGISVPANDGALFSHPFDLDSLVGVEALCALDSILSFPVTEEVVRAGGYSSVEEAVTHIVPRVERQWQKHRNKVKL